MSTTVTPTRSDVMKALRAFIQSLVGTNIEVIEGLGNRVAMPRAATTPGGVPGPKGFIVLTWILQNTLSTNLDSYADPFPSNGNGKTVSVDLAVTVQCDCYGQQSANWATIIATIMQDQYASDQLLPVCAPLYADAPQMAALIDEEQQYLERWTFGLHINYNPQITFVQDFATDLAPGVFNVEVTFPVDAPPIL